MDHAQELQLLDLAATGDREAYGRIVERYQTLICSLTYSACGDFARSEDLAQETFITAWNKLSELRDRERFKSWLCGIARNLTRNFLRVRRRKSDQPALPLEAAPDPAAKISPPQVEAIGREEAALIWQSLENVPEIYREPLVLYYRQEQSIAEVAAALDLTEDAVKQRLSRGRSLLKEKVTHLVESTLTRSRPGKAFTIAALAALPMAATEAAAAGLAVTAAKGSAATKTAASLSLWGAIAGPIVGLLGGYLGCRASIESACSTKERQFMKRMSWLVFGMAMLFTLSLLAFIYFGGSLVSKDPRLFGFGLTALILVGLTGFIIWSNKRLRRIRLEARDQGLVAPAERRAAHPLRCDVKGKEYRSKLCILGLPLVHIAFGGRQEGVYRRGIARGWIAIGDLSLGVLFSLGGIAVGGISIGGLAVGGITLGGGAVGAIAFGGCALGWVALGGAAIAWHGAWGGFAVAKHLAWGGFALAEQANTDAAHSALMELPLVQAGKKVMDHGHWFLVLTILPLFFLWRNRKAAGRR